MKERTAKFLGTLTVLTITALLVLTVYAFGHSWYPVECCTNIHCEAVPCDAILETTTDYVYEGMHFVGAQVKPSMDSMCHACWDHVWKKPMCLFIQNSV